MTVCWTVGGIFCYNEIEIEQKVHKKLFEIKK